MNNDEKWQLIKRYEKLIKHLIHKGMYITSFYSHEDCYQDCTIALLKALDKYNPNLSKPSTYITLVATRTIININRKNTALLRNDKLAFHLQK